MKENKVILTFNKEDEGTYKITIPHIKDKADIRNLDDKVREIANFIAKNCLSTAGEKLAKCKKAVYHNSEKAKEVEDAIEII